MTWFSITKKDIKILLKDPSAIVVLVMLPIMFITIMSFALGDAFGTDNAPIKILYIDNNQTEISEGYIETLSGMEGISLVPSEGKGADSKALIDSGDYVALLVIPSSFGDMVMTNQTIVLSMYTDAMQTTSANIVKQAFTGASRQFELTYQFEVYGENQGELMRDYVIDEVDKTIADIEGQLGFKLENASAPNRDELRTSVTADTKANMTKILDKPIISIESTSNNSAEIQPDTFQQNVPGYTVMFAFFIILWAGKSFLNEKQIGTWDRIVVSNITTPGIYFGKFAPNFVIGFVQVFLLLTFGSFAFGMGIGSSLLGVIVLSIALITCSTSLGMLIASVSKSESQVVGLSLFLVLSTAALGGTMVPLQIMPDIMQDISKIVPQSWALTGYQNLFVRDQGIESILPNVGVLLGFSLCFFLVSFIRIIKMRKEK
jgi:ABC-type multidrug transport system, permease component